MLDQVECELGVKEDAVPDDGRDLQQSVGVEDEAEMFGPRGQAEHALDADDAGDEAEGHGGEREEEGEDAEGPLPPAGEEVDHGPGLDEEDDLDENADEEREGFRGGAADNVGLGDVGKVAGPEGVGVVEGAGVVGGEENEADGVEEEGAELEPLGELDELDPRHEAEGDDEEHNGGAGLGAKVDAV